MAADYRFETDDFGHPLKWADPLNITWSFYSVGQPTEGIFSDALPSNSVFTQDIIDAFAAWSAVANINFIQVVDSGASDIRLGWEHIDGPSKILAETYYDSGFGGHLVDADIGFDSGDPWTLSGGDEKSQGAPFFITALHEIGHALGLDHYNAQSAVMNAFIDPSLTGLTIHDINGIVALYGEAESAPKVSAPSKSLAHNTTVAASSLFTASDSDGDAVVTYRFEDLSAAATSGYWVVNGVVQAANTSFDVAEADLATVSFVVGTTGTDLLKISASDATHFGSSTNFTITASNQAPVVIAANQSAVHGQILTAASLFTASDADAGDSAVSFQIIDKTTAATSGHWDIAGTNQAANLTITIAAADLGNLTFETGSGTDTLNVRAYDGVTWGAWKSFNVTAPADHAAVITAANLTATHGQILTAAELFGVIDADSDAIVSYRIVDRTTSASSGHWDIAGVNQLAGKTITFAAADLGDLTFETSSGTDMLSVQAFDGYLWGAAKSFNVVAPLDRAPVIAAANLTAAHGHVFTAAELFSASDADLDTIVSYRIVDKTTSASSGHWDIAGVDQLAGKTITVAAADLGDLTFETRSGADTLTVQAFDGSLWSAVKTIKVTAPVDHAPVVTGAGASVALNSHVAATLLFAVSDADGDAITSYQLQDRSAATSSGHWEIGGVAQPAGHPIDISAADIASVDFVGGSIAGIDHLMMRAYDDMVWGSWHNFDVQSHA
jgi:hypothetical protein